jgi:tetratricopeptide (TPR) repeat protein
MAPTVTSERDLAVLRSFARRIDPSDAGAHNNLGVLYFRKALWPEAVSSFSRALELDPKMAVAQRNLEIAYKSSGYYDRRITELREALRRRPDARDARWELARAFAAVGQYEEAVAEFGALLGQDPRDLGALIQLGLLEQRLGNLDTALEWFDRARELDPASSVVELHRGEVLYNLGANDGWQRYSIRESIPGDRKLGMFLIFLNGRLSKLGFSWCQQDETWDNWTEARDLAWRKEYQQALDSQLGGQIDFPWGRASVIQDSKSGGTDIWIDYSARGE